MNEILSHILTGVSLPTHHTYPANPVHGDIGLSQLEVRLVDTQSFQRLRRLKQLGLANLVYPGASHSRFAHSVGVFHIMSRAIDLMVRRDKFDETERQRLRIAALLHDSRRGGREKSREGPEGGACMARPMKTGPRRGSRVTATKPPCYLATDSGGSLFDIAMTAVSGHVGLDFGAGFVYGRGSDKVTRLGEWVSAKPVLDSRAVKG